MTTDMVPVAHRVVHRQSETADTATLTLEPVGAGLPRWTPGQFTMVYAFGVGEIPVSISGGDTGLLRHTVRAVGAVSRAVCEAPVGSTLGLRGPYGHGWPTPPANTDVIVMAGGIGLAPLRPVVTTALARPGRVIVLIGARTPDDLIFTAEYDQWRAAGAEVLVTVDRADAGWSGRVGVVTTLLDAVELTPETSVAYVCGPEVMMRLGARSLVGRGVARDRVAVSLERNMRCGIALCGHCQLGPLLLCRDGPVVDLEMAEVLLTTREL
ncbi:MAG: FAD/NAD(P)-binding protein [Micromonosporaceae bacterium]